MPQYAQACGGNLLKSYGGRLLFTYEAGFKAEEACEVSSSPWLLSYT